MNGITKIQLIGDNQGYLDTTDQVPFPVTFSVAEIRDITKRTGAFSKTITLPGTHNNNLLLGSYFDINIVAGTYNVNKIQQCLVIQNGVVIMDNAYIQLISVRKKQNVINEDDIIEYDVILKDTSSMFFSKIGSKELTDLKRGPFDVFNFPFTSEDIVASFDNQYSVPTDPNYAPYKYWLPIQEEWRTDYGLNSIPIEDGGARLGFYETKELAPAINAKFYWDQIHANAGFSYTWEGLDDTLVGFDKLLITDNKKNRKAPEEISEQSRIISNMSEDNTSSIRYVFEDDPVDAYTYPESRPFKCSLYYPDEVQDLFNYLETYEATDPGIPYPSALSNNVTIATLPLASPSLNGITVWSNPYFLNQAEVTVTINLNWGLYLKNNTARKWLCTDNATSAASAQYFEIWLRVKNETTGGIKEQVIKLVQPGTIGFYNFDTDTYYGAGYPGGGVTTAMFYDSNFTADILLTDMGSPTDDFTFSLDVRPKANSQNEIKFGTSASPTVPASVSIDLRLFAASIQIQATGIPYGAIIPIYAYVPAKIKQSDFIKSVSSMFNLYCVPDPTNSTNVIWKRRDDFYDQGPIVNWTKKLDRSQWQEVQFLPELSSKTITLTYKQDTDPANTTYFNATKEIYGQQKVVFSSEWIKTDETRELIWSPTPFARSIWGGTSPYYNNLEGDFNLRVFYDGGKLETDYTILLLDVPSDSIPPSAYFGAIRTETNYYPLTIHTNGEYGGGYDINYGICDFYFMPITTTENNLYNLNWKRTMNQLDNQKMLIVYFNLTALDIANLNMSSKIRIDNSYWIINRIIDFEFNKPGLTKVELLSIEDAMLIVGN